MRRMIGRMTYGMTVLLLTVVAACASSGTASESAPATPGTASGLTINIQNDFANASRMTIFIEPSAGGVRQSLGVVEPGTSRTFSHQGAQDGQYVLIRQGSGGDTRSERFTVSGATTVTWDLSGSRVIVSRR